MTEEPNLGGRPRKEIDIDVLKGMVRVFCTAEDCAAAFDCSVDTIDRRLKEEGFAGFAEFFKEFSAEGRASIRRAQFEKAVKKQDTGMLIWMGKQYLGQRDNLELSGPKGAPIQTITREMTEDEAAASYQAMLDDPLSATDDDDER
jgi:hypothetical protein